MKRTKLLISLVLAAGLTVGLGGSLLPASAQNRTVTVTLTTGQTLSASGDIPCDASVTGAPANLAASVQCTDLPTQTVSTPTATTPSLPTQSSPPPSPTATIPSPVLGLVSPGCGPKIPGRFWQATVR